MLLIEIRQIGDEYLVAIRNSLDKSVHPQDEAEKAIFDDIVAQGREDNIPTEEVVSYITNRINRHRRKQSRPQREPFQPDEITKRRHAGMSQAEQFRDIAKRFRSKD